MTETLIPGSAIERIQALAKNAEDFTVHTFETPKDIVGLPGTIPVGMDHRTNANGKGPIDLRDFAEKWRICPERRRGIATATTLASFIDLVNYHKLNESAIFAKTDHESPSLLCVVDYHPEPSQFPSFCEHRIQYTFPLSDEFKAWSDQDAESMTQADFAAWVEEHIADLTAPTPEEETANEGLFRTRTATPAQMIELSRGLQVNVASVVKSATVLQTGEVGMVFQETHHDGAGEKLTVPGMFMVAIPIFVAGAAVRIPVRLRYRVSGGKVSWFFQMFRWRALVRERVVSDLEIVARETAIPAYEGHPER